MISMREFHEQFVARHEFEYDDLEFLPKKYPDILFKDLPQAWICCIADHLSSINQISKVVSVSQIYGFPVIQYENDISDRDFDIIQKMERQILCTDIDLVNQIDGIILN